MKPKPSKEKTPLQKRYEFMINNFQENGFTEQQAVYLVNLLNEFIPIV